MKVFNEKGFTFVETILTIVLLSIGLWGGLALFQNAASNVVQSDWRVMASQLASEKIEQIIADKTFQGYDFIIEGNYPDEVLAAPYNGFSRTVTITEVNTDDLSTPEPGSGYKKVDVQISWGNEEYQTLIVSTLLTDYS